MTDTNNNSLTIFEKLGKRFAVLCILVVLGLTLIQFPNPVTHECVPNIRTQMGISSEGYPTSETYAQHFCEDGYYPVLKFGQDAATEDKIIMLFFVLLPLLLLTPTAIILIDRSNKQNASKTHRKK
jgi:hypothetical protein